jgi:hypothetical protein
MNEKLKALQEKHAQELRELELENSFKSNKAFENLKMFISMNYQKPLFFIDLEKTKVSDITGIIKELVLCYPTISESQEIDYKGKITHFSPFILNTSSGVRDGKVILSWESLDCSIRITLPFAYYSDDVLGYYSRGVVDSEYHYFGGVSMNEIRAIKITKRAFDVFETLNYYGGDTKCIITDVSKRKEYDFMALNGHLPEFEDFWNGIKETL